MENKPPIYNDEGRVVDPEIARRGAEVENEYRKKGSSFSDLQKFSYNGRCEKWFHNQLGSNSIEY